jgi:hypothetical protein
MKAKKMIYLKILVKINPMHMLTAKDQRIPVQVKTETPQDGKTISGHRPTEKMKTSRLDKIQIDWLEMDKANRNHKMYRSLCAIINIVFTI